MPYPAYMEESIRKLEATRERRLKAEIPLITTRERESLVRQYHPDYAGTGRRELLLGVNKGQMMPEELANQLEGNSRIDPDKIDLSKIDYDTDVLVVGSGGAGLSAALLAQENGARVLIATKLRLGDSNTIGAEGGTQAADRPNDSPVLHYLDTMGGGHFENVPELVWAMTRDAPLIIKWLEDLGVVWDKEPDGSMRELKLAGECRARVHSCKDHTGLEVMRALCDEVRCRNNIDYIEFEAAIELIMDDNGRVAGAILLNLETSEVSIVRAKAVILATGGLGRLHTMGFPTTNHYGATADGLVLAYRAGCSLVNGDSIQYHPTGVVYPSHLVGVLVTENVRALGGEIVNIDGEEVACNLEPRDVLASFMIRECTERQKGITTPAGNVGVWEDIPLIDILQGKGTITNRLPTMVRQFARFGIDITREPVLVYPTIHYQNGGVKMDDKAAAEIPGLWVPGEVGGGVHGRNRLGGNSTLDIYVFGRRAGREAARYAKEVKLGKLSLNHVYQHQKELELLGIARERPFSPLLLPNYTKQPNDYLADRQPELGSRI
ncbi:MAG: FAD-binding protein [Chloroflexi bacterium]|nr:FAD-binding protein [Chloroflexota bacterium]